MKQIPLTQGKFALVDDEDFELLNKHKWYAKKNREIYYAIRGIGAKGKKETISMHRVILGLTDSKIFGDHIDHNGLNNQRYNLRECDNSQNQKNRRSNKNSTSKYKGPYLDKGKWRCKIYVNKKNIHLGYFDNEIDAAKAYDEMAKLHYGEFANLNFKKSPLK